MGAVRGAGGGGGGISGFGLRDMVSLRLKPDPDNRLVRYCPPCAAATTARRSSRMSTCFALDQSGA